MSYGDSWAGCPVQNAAVVGARALAQKTRPRRAGNAQPGPVGAVESSPSLAGLLNPWGACCSCRGRAAGTGCGERCVGSARVTPPAWGLGAGRRDPDPPGKTQPEHLWWALKRVLSRAERCGCGTTPLMSIHVGQWQPRQTQHPQNQPTARSRPERWVGSRQGRDPERRGGSAGGNARCPTSGFLLCVLIIFACASAWVLQPVWPLRECLCRAGWCVAWLSLGEVL